MLCSEHASALSQSASRQLAPMDLTSSLSGCLSDVLCLRLILSQLFSYAVGLRLQPAEGAIND